MSQFAAAMEKAGVKAPVKMVSQPLAKNKIMIRLENVADLLDQGDQSHNVTLKWLLQEMWADAN